jgi:hypothetical protein
LKLSLNVSNSGNEVDGTTSDEHGGFSRENARSNAVNLVRGNSVDLVAILVEGEVTEGHVVSGDLLKSVLLTLHRHEDVHLENVLSAR